MASISQERALGSVAAAETFVRVADYLYDEESAFVNAAASASSVDPPLAPPPLGIEDREDDRVAANVKLDQAMANYMDKIRDKKIAFEKAMRQQEEEPPSARRKLNHNNSSAQLEPDDSHNDCYEEESDDDAEDDYE